MKLIRETNSKGPNNTLEMELQSRKILNSYLGFFSHFFLLW